MSISLQTIETGIKKVPIRALIYGPNGVGKSYLASQFPKPIFLDLEDNVHHFNVAKQRLKSWSDVQLFLSLLLKEKHGFQTLVIDTLDQLELLGKPVACKEVGIQNINEGYGKGVAQLVRLFEGFRNTLEDLTHLKKMHLVFIAHAKMTQITELGSVSYHQMAPFLNERISSLFTDWCNIVGYAQRLVTQERCLDVGFGKTQITAAAYEDKDLGPRVLHVEASPQYVAKNVFDFKTKNGCMSLKASDLLSQVQSFYRSIPTPPQEGDIS